MEREAMARQEEMRQEEIDRRRELGGGPASGDEQVPPIHEEPQPAPQPMHEMVKQLERAWSDIGALISRTDQLEATVRRIDRQTIMMVGSLALVLYVTRQALAKVQELDGS